MALLESLCSAFLQWFYELTTPATGFYSTNLQDWLVWMRKPTFPEVSQGAWKPRSSENSQKWWFFQHWALGKPVCFSPCWGGRCSCMLTSIRNFRHFSCDRAGITTQLFVLFCFYLDPKLTFCPKASCSLTQVGKGVASLWPKKGEKQMHQFFTGKMRRSGSLPCTNCVRLFFFFFLVLRLNHLLYFFAGLFSSWFNKLKWLIRIV